MTDSGSQPVHEFKELPSADAPAVVTRPDRVTHPDPDRGMQDETTGGLARYLAAAVLVRLADEGARVGLVLLALDRTGSAGVGGLLIAALLIPHVVAAPAVGWLTDRARQPRIVLVVAAAGFAAALVAAVLLLGRIPLWLVVVSLVLGGCCGPALTGGLSSQLARLVPADRLPRTYGKDSLTYNVSGIAGPAIAGTLAGLWNPAAATITLAAVAAAGAFALAITPFPARSAESDRSGTRAGGASLTAGFRAILTDPVLRVVTAASSLGQLGPGALAVVAAVLAASRGQTAATGWLLTASAAGGLIGSLWWTWRPAPPARAARTVMLSLAGIGAPLAVSALTSQSLILTAGLFAVSGFFLGPFIGAVFTIRQDHAPTDAQAQVFTISAGLKTTTAAAGAALGGAIASIPVPTQLLLVGASPLLASTLGGLALALHHRSAND